MAGSSGTTKDDGHYEMEFQPVSMEGIVQPNGKHVITQTISHQMALRSKEAGNEAVKKQNWQEAVSRYSEGIMQARQAEQEKDVEESEEEFKKHRVLMATFYLNLSHCFLQLEQWTHAYNCATRAIQGDENPPNKKHDVLDNARKAKAFFRKATAKASTNDYSTAVSDLESALELTPDDAALKQALNTQKRNVAAADKKSSAKLAGFLKSEETGKSKLPDFSSDRREHEPAIPKLKEPMKLKEGLWMAPETGLGEHGKPVKEEGPTVTDIYEVEEELQEKARALALKDPEAKEKMISMGINIWKEDEEAEKENADENEEKVEGAGGKKDVSGYPENPDRQKVQETTEESC